MSDDDVMVDGRPLSSLKVTELKEELENRKLSTKGVKAVLQERLREALGAQVDDAVEQNPIVAGYLARQTAALAEARKRTKSEASGTVTPQSDLSPSKKSEASPSKRQTPRKGQKTAELEPKSEPEPEKASEEKELEKEESDAVDEAEVNNSADSKPSDTPQPQSSEEKVVAKEEVEIGGDSEQQDEINESSSTPQDSEEAEKIVEKEQQLSLKEEIVEEEEQVSEKSTEYQVQKKEDDDELDYGDDDEKEHKGEESMDAEDVKEKKVVQVEDSEEKKYEGVKKEEKVRGSVSHRRVSSPSSRHPVSNIVHIRGLTRPFTERQLRNEIEKHGGEIVDFWIDKVKSHCFAKLNTDINAGNVLKAMHDTVWPDGNPKKLAIVFETEDNMTRYKEGKDSGIIEAGTIGGRAERLSTNSQASVLGGKASLQITLQNVLRENDKLDSERKEKRERGSLASRLTRIEDRDKVKDDRKRGRSETPPFSRGAGFMDEKKAKHDEKDRGGRREEQRRDEIRRDERRVVEDDVPKKSLDQLFRKTVALPPIYYLPLTEEQIAAKANKKGSRENDAVPERMERSDRDRNRGERVDRGERPDRVERVDRGDRVERPRRRD